MLNINSCRFCQHYVPEGRRGGNCTKLRVPVQGSWSPCPLVSDPFSSPWDDTVALIPTSPAYPKGQELNQAQKEMIPLPLAGNMLLDLP
jgi:hypothetical protein